MAYILGYDITNYEISLINYLLLYRGVKPNHLAIMHYGINFTKTQEKTIYKYLKRLVDQKLIAKYRLQNGLQGSMYYLTPKGFDLAKELFNINEAERGEGWINNNECTSHGDFPYELFSPPMEQASHHLLLIDFLVNLQSTKTESIEYRLNLYSSTTFMTADGKSRFRPDAEVRLQNNRIYAIEVDRGSENHEQLCKKFRTYRHYYDTLKENGLSIKHVGIIFVVEDKRKIHGMKRRWKNIAAAFFKEMKDYHLEVNLIFTTLRDANKTILLEINKKDYEQKFLHKLGSSLERENHDNINFFCINDKAGNPKVTFSTIASNGNKFEVVIYMFSQMYETSIYSKYYDVYRHIEMIKSNDSVAGLELSGFRKIISYANEVPSLINDFSPYQLSDGLDISLKGYDTNVELQKID